MPFDPEDLLRSLADEAPSGENLEYDPDFTALETAAQPTEERAMGDHVLAAEPPDYDEVRDRALDLLGRTRDLRVAVILAEAALRCEGLPGFAATLDYIAGSLELYWDSLHPQLDADDDDDPTMRVNATLGLADPDTVLRALRLAPLTDSRAFGRVSLRDIQLAEGELEPGPDDQPRDRNEIHAAFQDTPPERLAEIASAASEALDAMARIGSVFDARLGAEGPDLTPLRRLTQDIARRLPEAPSGAAVDAPSIHAAPAPQGEGGALDPAAAAAPGSSPVRAAPGAIESPQDVIAALDRIEDYYRRKEPSSPLPMLIRRARKLVSADFLTVIRELAPMGLENVALVGGLSDDEQHGHHDD